MIWLDCFQKFINVNLLIFCILHQINESFDKIRVAFLLKVFFKPKSHNGNNFYGSIYFLNSILEDLFRLLILRD